MRNLLCTPIAFALATLIGGNGAQAASQPSGPEGLPTGRVYPWCSPEVESLPDNVCYFDGIRGERRSLIVFLHGVVPKYSPWQWTQQRALRREARRLGFAVLLPQGAPVGPNGDAGFAWPGSRETVERYEEQLIGTWVRARQTIEAREGRPFDEVFVVGFSSGAYYATSLALRGRLTDVAGYALLAGGALLYPPPREVQHRPPIFVGVSAKDRHSAPAARALGQALSTWGWPNHQDEEPVGHMVADVHMAHALEYLRRARP